jgi:DNA end-binding protein Ku
VPRPIWSGSISFGLVNVPVKAYSGVHDHTVHFHQLDKNTGARIRYAKVSAKTGKVVDDDEIEKGYEVSKGEYVVVDPDELDELRPRSTRTIDITDFVDLHEVDPIYYTNTYWLGASDEGAQRAYRLLLAAMEDAQRVGIGTVVMRNKQYLTAIRPLDGALAMSTMRFADEVVPKADIDTIPSARAKPDAKELRLAEQIIESLMSDWDPKRYHDTYTEQVQELIEAKAKGEEITVEPEEEKGAEVLDLMAALQASLERGKQARGTSSHTSGNGRSGNGTAPSSRSTSRTAKAKAKAKPKARKSTSTASKSRTSKSPTSKSTGSRRSATKAKKSA